MTREEAISYMELAFYNSDGEDLSDLYKDMCRIAIADMKKQIPRKITNYRKTENAIYGNCPICSRRVLKEKYCPRCGVALDWSEEDG